MQNIPKPFEAMVQYPQWILYKLVPVSDVKTDKLPVDWRTGRLPPTGRGGANIWTTIDNATVAAAKYGAEYGVGFSFAESDPFWFIDLDKALQADNTWAWWACDIINMLPGCAVEVSQSGKGLHLFGSGVIPPHACKCTKYPELERHLEMYHTGRFVALTGYHATGDASHDCTAGLAAVVAKYFPITTPVRAVINHPDREATDETIEELRSALKYLSSDDRHQWVSVGIALAGIGERGYELWAEWSATSDKHDPDKDLAQWETFMPERTGFAAIFSKAQVAGWVNPKARQPVNVAEVFGGAVNTATPQADNTEQQPVSVTPQPTPITCSTLAFADDQEKIFAGCVYILNKRQILTPSGDMLDKERFDDWYGKFSYVKNRNNDGTPEKSAWAAFVRSQMHNFPRAQGWCFRPELAPGQIIVEAERSLVNTFWPIKTLCIEGDVTPFTKHLSLLLPDRKDYEYYLCYLAALIQYPGRKFPWCPVLQGAKGNGKSFIGTCMEEIVGYEYSHRPSGQDINNKFTGWLERKLLIILEELGAYEKRETMETLKPLITNKRVEMQKKGENQVTGENRANFLIFINPKGAVPVDDDERRYGSFHTAQQSAEDINRDGMGGDYFPKLFKWAETGGFAHIHYFLKHYPIPDEMNPATLLHRAPRTSTTNEAIQHSRGTVENEILEAIAAHEPGFCGGWIAHTALDALLVRCKMERAMPRIKRKEMLRGLGYTPHPALMDGRVNNPIPSYGRAALYITKDHPCRGVTSSAEIAKLFMAAQTPGASGLVQVFGGVADKA